MSEQNYELAMAIANSPRSVQEEISRLRDAQNAGDEGRCVMTTQHYVEHFANEMEKLRALDDKTRAKAIAYITEDECMAAIKAMALPCPFCGSANLYFYLQARSCLVICGACGAQKPGGAGMAVFAPESREWQMQNLADAVNAWSQRAQKEASAAPMPGNEKRMPAMGRPMTQKQLAAQRVAAMTCIIQDDNSLSRAMVVKTERTDGKRAAAPLVVASYCPFCGEKSK